jgi:hypothetical protein
MRSLRRGFAPGAAFWKETGYYTPVRGYFSFWTPLGGAGGRADDTAAAAGPAALAAPAQAAKAPPAKKAK